MIKQNATHPMGELSAEVAKLRSEVRRLRGWLRYWRTEAVAAFGVRDGFVVGMDDALRGKPAPRREKP